MFPGEAIHAHALAVAVADTMSTAVVLGVARDVAPVSEKTIHALRAMRARERKRAHAARVSEAQSTPVASGLLVALELAMLATVPVIANGARRPGPTLMADASALRVTYAIAVAAFLVIAHLGTVSDIAISALVAGLTSEALGTHAASISHADAVPAAGSLRVAFQVATFTHETIRALTAGITNEPRQAHARSVAAAHSLPAAIDVCIAEMAALVSR
eukprot:2022586-Rhodomonas_salina.1